MHLASEAGRLDVVDRLTEAKADLEAKGGPSRREPQRLGRLGRSEGRSDSGRVRPENGSDKETRDRLEKITVN